MSKCCICHFDCLKIQYFGLDKLKIESDKDKSVTEVYSICRYCVLFTLEGGYAVWKFKKGVILKELEEMIEENLQAMKW